MSSRYRSYIVRVRERLDEAGSLHLDVEELQGGQRRSLTGPEARDLADGLGASVNPDGATDDDFAPESDGPQTAP